MAYLSFKSDPSFYPRMNEAIKKDLQMSKRTKESTKGLHYYSSKPSLGKVAKGVRWNIPD